MRSTETRGAVRSTGRGLTRREFLAAGASVLLAAGCGGVPGNQAEVARAAAGGGARYTGPPVDLGFWNGFTGGDGPIMLELVDQFNSEHPNINVDMVTMIWSPDFYQKTPSAVAAGEGPDVAVMHVDFLALNAARGVIVPLDEVVRSLGLRESDFAPTAWKAGVYKGKRYGIPLDTHPLGLYYNKSVLEKGGLDPDRPPQTREEYEEALRRLKEAGIQGSWVSPNFFTGWHMFASLLWQFGGDLFNEDASRSTVNSEAGVEALTWMVDLIKDGYSPANVAQDGDLIALQNGQNAFLWHGIFMLGVFEAVPELEWGAAPLPQIGSEKAAWANSHNFVIPYQRNPDPNRLRAAKVFVDWILDHSFQWAEAGQVPTLNKVRESKEFEDLEWQPEFARELPYVRFGPSAPGVSEINQNILFTAVQQAVLLDQEPKAALDTAAERADKLLRQNLQKYGG